MHSEVEDISTNREVFPAVMKGVQNKCPSCGKGRLFKSFLKVEHECSGCGQELHHERADDFPPYIVIFIVGHIVVTALMMVEANWDLSMTTHVLMWIPLTIILTLLLLQPAKGGVIGLQWALRMHGFDGNGERDR